MSLEKISLHKYSLAEELISSISHGVGAGLSVAALIVGVVTAVVKSNAWSVVSMAIYGATLIILFTMSTIYHGLRPNSGKKVFRVLDHCSVFLLIAGTYTPFTLVTLRGPFGWVLFGIVWGAAALGITLTAVDFTKSAKIGTVCYVAMGWCMVIAAVPMIHRLAWEGLILLLAGGILYTVGAGLYCIGKHRKYIHSVWHFFVLAGSILHYFCILLYVAPVK